MKKIFISAAMATVVATAAGAQQYDRKLEQAAIKIVASKMGELRGGIDVGGKLVLVEPIDRSAPTHLGADRFGLLVAEAATPNWRSF